MMLRRARAGNESLELRGNLEAARRPLGLPRLDTAPSRALGARLDALRVQRGAYMSVRVARRCSLPAQISDVPFFPHLTLEIKPLWNKF